MKEGLKGAQTLGREVLGNRCEIVLQDR